MVNNPPAMQEVHETRAWSLGQEDPLERGHGNPLQYSCLKNPMDRGAWQAPVHRVAKSQTQQNQLNIHARGPSVSISLQLQWTTFYRRPPLVFIEF